MKEQLISFETAKLAKEKGFDEECCNYYKNGKIEDRSVSSGSSTDTDVSIYLEEFYDNYNAYQKSYVSASTQSLLQRWLREKYNIYIEIEHWHNQKQGFIKCGYRVYKNYENKSSHVYLNAVISYEEALEIGLQEALKLI